MPVKNQNKLLNLKVLNQSMRTANTDEARGLETHVRVRKTNGTELFKCRGGGGWLEGVKNPHHEGMLRRMGLLWRLKSSHSG